MIETKICSKCKEEKPITSFSKDKSRKSGVHPQCKSCINKNTRKHYQENKEKYHQKYREKYLENSSIFHERTKEWKKNNRNKSNELSRILRNKNPELHRSAVKKWRENNKDKVAEMGARRRARKKNAIPKWVENDEWYSFLLLEIYDLSSMRTRLTGIDYQVDHMVPIAAKKNKKEQVACGLHVPWNLEIVTQIENSKKNSYYWPDMWAYD